MSESVLSIRVGNHPRVSFNRGEGEILDLAQALNPCLGFSPYPLLAVMCAKGNSLC